MGKSEYSGAVVTSPDSEGLGAAVVAGVGSNLTQPSGSSYFSLHTFIWITCIRNDPGPDFFVEVCLNLKLYMRCLQRYMFWSAGMKGLLWQTLKLPVTTIVVCFVICLWF